MWACFSVWLFMTIIADSMVESEVSLKIVGGEDSPITEFPYQVSISRNQRFICGGSIITVKHVLTAAHCTAGNYGPESYTVRAGSSYTYQNGTLHKVARISPHERFVKRKGMVENDVCLLEVYPYFNIDRNHRIVALHTSFMGLKVGELATVTGFGKTGEEAKASKKLMAVKIPLIDWLECWEIYAKTKVQLTPDFICAGVWDNHKNSCKGDSGGPLTVRGVLVGIVSWGVGCTKPGFPGVYTNVAYFQDWIFSKVLQSFT